MKPSPLPASFAAACLLALSGAHAAAGSLDTNDPRKIMEAVDARDTGDKMIMTTTMTIIDDSNNERARKIRTRALKFDGGTKRLMIFESPADVRNTVLLQFDYDDGGKDDDQWLYLPSLRKATRISGGDKSGAFMGSDFSYSDLTKQDPDEYEFELLKESTKVNGEECWMIEAKPKTKKTRTETGYVKSHIWVSKDKLMPLQAKAWIAAGKKLKYMKFDDIEKVDGIWVARKTAARTTRGKSVESTTIIRVTGVEFGNDSVGESDFTQRRMEQGL